jgi:hypothetical protein
VGRRAQARGGARQLRAEPRPFRPVPARQARLDERPCTSGHCAAPTDHPRPVHAARRTPILRLVPGSPGERERRYRRCLPRTSSATSSAGSRSCSAKRSNGGSRHGSAARSRPRWPCAGAPCASAHCSLADPVTSASPERPGPPPGRSACRPSRIETSSAVASGTLSTLTGGPRGGRRCPYSPTHCRSSPARPSAF